MILVKTTLANRVDDALLREVVRRFRAVGDPLKIVLFGSRARGTPHERSDLDLLVVENGPHARERHRASTYRRSLMGVDFGSGIDVVVTTPQDIEEWSEAPLAFVTTALREGRVLYEKE